MLGPWIKANWKWSNRRWQEYIDILGISELKWTGMGEFNSDDHYIYYCRQESLRRNGVAIMVNKVIRNAVQFSSVASDSLRPHESQHARPPCPSPTSWVHSDSRPSSQWCHPAISSSVVPFSSCPQSLPASEFFPMSHLAVLGCNLKNNRMISVHFQDKPFNITVIQVYAPTSNAEQAEVPQFY